MPAAAAAVAAVCDLAWKGVGLEEKAEEVEEEVEEEEVAEAAAEDGNCEEGVSAPKRLSVACASTFTPKLKLPLPPAPLNPDIPPAVPLLPNGEGAAAPLPGVAGGGAAKEKAVVVDVGNTKLSDAGCFCCCCAPPSVLGASPAVTAPGSMAPNANPAGDGAAAGISAPPLPAWPLLLLFVFVFSDFDEENRLFLPRRARGLPLPRRDGFCALGGVVHVPPTGGTTPSAGAASPALAPPNTLLPPKPNPDTPSAAPASAGRGAGPAPN